MREPKKSPSKQVNPRIARKPTGWQGIEGPCSSASADAPNMHLEAASRTMSTAPLYDLYITQRGHARTWGVLVKRDVTDSRFRAKICFSGFGPCTARKHPRNTRETGGPTQEQKQNHTRGGGGIRGLKLCVVRQSLLGSRRVGLLGGPGGSGRGRACTQHAG